MLLRIPKDKKISRLTCNSCGSTIWKVKDGYLCLKLGCDMSMKVVDIEGNPVKKEVL